MIRGSCIAACAGLLLLASGCHARRSASSAAVSNAAAALDNAASATGNAAGAIADATGNLADQANASRTGVLSVYVGKHPSEKVGDLTFLDQPIVQAAIADTVHDARVRDFVFHYTGPDAPIALKRGRFLAWGCEEHNCGYHDWSVSITPDGKQADVCFYHNDASADGPATWYLADGTSEKRPGNCPSE